MDVPIAATDPLARLTPAVSPDDRLTVRHRLDDGSATDVIGFVTAVDDATVTLITADGAVRTVRRDSIILARRVPSARGGRDPMRTDADALQRVAAPAWIDASRPLGDWLLRDADGFTRRANSVLAVGDPACPVDVATATVVAHYSARGLTPLAQVITGSDVDLTLQAQGWVSGGPETTLWVTRLVALRERVAVLRGRRADQSEAQVGTSESPSAGWMQALITQRGLPRDAELGPAAVQVITGSPPVCFAEAAGRDDEAPWAIGRGHLSGDWLGIAAMWTDPAHRRSGLAVAIIDALARWAAHRGARQVYLQVEADNQAALRLYELLGFTHHHDYRYLRPGP